VDDLVDGLIGLMNSADDVTGPINLGNPGEVSMQELAETIRDLTGSRSKIVFKPLPADDPQRREPDITLAKQRLGWSPQVPLREGLTRTIAYFDALLRAASPAARLAVSPEPVN
jgi:UDP-glucuronate decarboxylase